MKQKTNQGCLAINMISLLKELGEKVDFSEEQEILNAAQVKHREDFWMGHLIVMAKRFPERKFRVYVSDKEYADFINEGTPENVLVEAYKMSSAFFDGLLERGPVITYICAVLSGEGYFNPHVVITKRKTDAGYEVYDPWVGEVDLREPYLFFAEIALLEHGMHWAGKFLTIE